MIPNTTNLIDVISLIDMRASREGATSSRAALTAACEGRLEEALGAKSSDILGLTVWSAGRTRLAALTHPERSFVSTWARLKLELGKTHDTTREYEKELTRHTEWMRVRALVGSPEEHYSGDLSDSRSKKVYVAALRSLTPLSRLHYFLRVEGWDWALDAQWSRKAYIMAVWSEVSYFQLVDHELAGADRYKILQPSLTKLAFRTKGLSIDLEEVVPAVAEYSVQIRITDDYLYLVADMWGAVVVAVRGTRVLSTRDWLINFSTEKVAHEAGVFHAGFLKEALIAKGLLEGVIAHRRPVYFTGHSMGAAVAAILSKIWGSSSERMAPYLFACPRFEAGRALSALRRYSYVQPWDFVPHLPPRFQGFINRGEIRMLLPEGEQQRGLAVSLAHWVWTRSTDQHAIEHYRRLLGEQVGEHFAATTYVDAVFNEMERASKCSIH